MVFICNPIMAKHESAAIMCPKSENAAYKQIIILEQFGNVCAITITLPIIGDLRICTFGP